VQVAGADVEVKRGDFYDSTTAVYAEAHQVAYDWEG
jgi:hypothetical protein